MQAELSARDIERIHWMTLALRLPTGGVGATFLDNDSCMDRLAAVRWPTIVACPKCKGENIAPPSTRKSYRCRECGYHFSVTAGTFAHGASKKLLTYFLAAEDIILRKATSIGHAHIVAHGFKDRHRLAYETARRFLELLTNELLLKDGGLLGHCICSQDFNLPQDIELGGREHFFWLLRALTP
jgi:hypothetical protein